MKAALHTAFAPDRVHPKREFFKIDPQRAIVILRLLEVEDATPQVRELLDQEALAAVNEEKLRQAYLQALNSSMGQETANQATVSELCLRYTIAPERVSAVLELALEEWRKEGLTRLAQAQRQALNRGDANADFTGLCQQYRIPQERAVAKLQEVREQWQKDRKR